ncbi:MAG: hypothetical protein HQ494_02275 [Rhodospirillales bacterium]|nr:hypothetical protein [Rhodospirillales bacterium]
MLSALVKPIIRFLKLGPFRRLGGRMVHFAARLSESLGVIEDARAGLEKVNVIFECDQSNEPQAACGPKEGIISISPHNIRIYELFLREQLSRGTVFITSKDLYGGQPLDPDTRYVLLRHDIDYAPEKIHQFTKLEEAWNVRSDIHVIVDGSSYDLEPYVRLLISLKEKGFVIGLHTLAPLAGDFFAALRKETETFEGLFACPPDVFSVHGPPGPPQRPENWEDIRAHFLKKIAARLPSFGFKGSHNISGIERWIEDAGRGGEFSYLPESWLYPPFQAGKVLGVLTHPCHWTEWPIAWSVPPEMMTEHPVVDEFFRKARAWPGEDG